MNILIIRVSAIGDVLHTLPAIFLMKRLCPHAKISWVVQKKAAALLENQPYLDTVWVLPDNYLRPRNWKATIKILSSIRAKKWDAIIDFQGLTKTALLISLIRGEKFGFSWQHVREKISCLCTHHRTTPIYTNIVQKNLALASDVLNKIAPHRSCTPLHELKKDFTLSIDSNRQTTVDAWLKQEKVESFLLLCPNTTWPSKHWPVEHWKQTINLLLATHTHKHSVIIVGKHFGGAAATLAEDCYRLRQEVTIAPFFDLLATAYLIKKATLVIAPDTGLLHMADFLGTSCIGIFGPTRKEKHGPFINENNQKYALQIACPHLYEKYHGKTNNQQCMYQLTPQQLFDQIIRYLAMQRSTHLN